MKLSRIWAPLGLAATVLLAVPFGAQAQTTVRPSILNQTRQAQTVRRAPAAQAPSYNYIGIGGGDNGFVVNGKVAVSNNVSIRPEIATDFNFDDGEDVSYLVPVTYDFNTIGQGRTGFNPFVGAGVSGDIGDDSNVEFTTVAGADYRFARNYVANGSVNYSPFADSDEVGFTLGVGRAF